MKSSLITIPCLALSLGAALADSTSKAKEAPCSRVATTADLAPANFLGKKVVLSYKGASMTEECISEPEEKLVKKTISDDKPHFQTIIGEFPVTRPLWAFNNGSDVECASLVIYKKCSANEFQLRLIPLYISDDKVAAKVNKLITNIDKISLKQIFDHLRENILDSDETITITMNTPTTGTATGTYCAGDGKVSYTGISVTLSEDTKKLKATFIPTE